MSEEEIDSNEPQESPPVEAARQALIINVQSWATPVVGILMLMVGLLAGYFVRPLFAAQMQQGISAANAPISSTETADQALAVVSEATADAQAASMQQLMDTLMPQIRHIRGNPDAAVTLLEFSDFQ